MVKNKQFKLVVNGLDLSNLPIMDYELAHDVNGVTRLKLYICGSDVSVVDGYLRDEATKVEEPKYYAKIKGWDNEKIQLADKYWNYSRIDKMLHLDNNADTYNYKTKLTKTEWNELGIDETNADFEEVTE